MTENVGHSLTGAPQDSCLEEADGNSRKGDDSQHYAPETSGSPSDTHGKVLVTHNTNSVTIGNRGTRSLLNSTYRRTLLCVIKAIWMQLIIEILTMNHEASDQRKGARNCESGTPTSNKAANQRCRYQPWIHYRKRGDTYNMQRPSSRGYRIHDRGKQTPMAKAGGHPG